MVDVARRCQGRPDPFFDQGSHLDHVLPLGGARLDGIAGPDHRGWLRRQVVDPHVAGADMRRLRPNGSCKGAPPRATCRLASLQGGPVLRRDH